MPAPLRTLMVALWVACLAGAVLITLLSLGWVGWVPFAVAGVAALVLGVPAGIWTARRIKRDDPAWSAERERKRAPRV